MEPSDDGLAELIPEIATIPPFGDGEELSHDRAADTNGVAEGRSSDLQEWLRALQAVRVGDFSVRLPADHVGKLRKAPESARLTPRV